MARPGFRIQGPASAGRFAWKTGDATAMSYYRQGPFRPGGQGIGIGVPPLTPFVRMIMIACGSIWLVQFLLYQISPELHQEIVRWLGVTPGRFLRGAIWQPVTYMFLHSPVGIMHILFNMLILWMFGGELERAWGSRAFLRYYLVCGVGAGIAAVLFGLVGQGMGAVSTVGASGAVYGLMIAYGVVFAERTILFLLIFPMKARTFAMIIFAVTVFSTISQSGGGVSHIAHLGGAVIGYLYLKRAWRVDRLYREIVWKIRRRKFKVLPPNDDDFDRWVN